MVAPDCGHVMRTDALQPDELLTTKIAATAPVKSRPPPIAPTYNHGESPPAGWAAASGCDAAFATSLPTPLMGLTFATELAAGKDAGGVAGACHAGGSGERSALALRSSNRAGSL